MTAHVTGQYRVTMFDRVGSRVKTMTAQRFTDAQLIGDARISAGECHSYAISRVLFNSLDTHVENFDVRQQ